jgi:hypothetical protein
MARQVQRHASDRIPGSPDTARRAIGPELRLVAQLGTFLRRKASCLVSDQKNRGFRKKPACD